MLLVCFVDWSLDDQHCVLCPHACAARLCTSGRVVAAQQHVQRAHICDCPVKHGLQCCSDAFEL